MTRLQGFSGYLAGAGYNKYKNQKVSIRGETFDSTKEYEYYLILKDREKHGEILDLQRQVPIEIQPGFIMPDGKKVRPINYVADFIYTDSKTLERHVIDVKGFRTEVYSLKKKLLAYQGIFIEEV